MFCGYCGKQIGDANNYCPYCGQETKRESRLRKYEDLYYESEYRNEEREPDESDYYVRPSEKRYRSRKKRVKNLTAGRTTVRAKNGSFSAGTADIVSRVSGIAASVILLVAGLLPYFQPNTAADSLSDIASMLGVEGAEPFKLTSPDILPVFEGLAAVCVAMIIAIVLHGRIPQLIFSLLCLLVCIGILYMCATIMDDPGVRMVYEYGSGYMVFILGTITTGLSALLRIAANISEKSN